MYQAVFANLIYPSKETREDKVSNKKVLEKVLNGGEKNNNFLKQFRRRLKSLNLQLFSIYSNGLIVHCLSIKSDDIVFNKLCRGIRESCRANIPCLITSQHLPIHPPSFSLLFEITKFVRENFRFRVCR